jgi:hypothetical protein
MWQADEAWRASLRGVLLSDVARTLGTEVPPELWANTFQWVLSR